MALSPDRIEDIAQRILSTSLTKARIVKNPPALRKVVAGIDHMLDTHTHEDNVYNIACIMDLCAFSIGFLSRREPSLGKEISKTFDEALMRMSRTIN